MSKGEVYLNLYFAGPLAVVYFIGKYFGIDPGSLLSGWLVSAGIVGTPSRFSSKIRIHARSKELDRGLTPNSQTQPGAGKFVFDKLFKPSPATQANEPALS